MMYRKKAFGTDCSEMYVFTYNSFNQCIQKYFRYKFLFKKLYLEKVVCKRKQKKINFQNR